MAIPEPHRVVSQPKSDLSIFATSTMKFLVLMAIFCSSVGTATATECERLKASLTYTQEEAPRDLSGVVRTQRRTISSLQ